MAASIQPSLSQVFTWLRSVGWVTVRIPPPYGAQLPCNTGISSANGLELAFTIEA